MAASASAARKTSAAIAAASRKLRRRGGVPIAGFDAVTRRPTRSAWIKSTYPKKAAAEASAHGHELMLSEALREGLDEEMERDPRVCVVGGDVGQHGGSDKVTKGLATKHGDLGVIDTQIAESSATGMGIGGIRPVVEGINMGFLLQTHNLISINCCGTLHHTSGWQDTLPVVIHGPGGVGLESYFQSIPGLQMVACSTPYSAKGLVKAAIRSENPVVIFEHVQLSNLKERVPDKEYICDLEEAETVRSGKQVTILTYSRMRYRVMEAVKTLVSNGYDPEVIDIRSLKPFDIYTIRKSVSKTRRVLIVEETVGIGASLMSAIGNLHIFDYLPCFFLEGPVMCLPSQDVPVVQPPQIVAAVEELSLYNALQSDEDVDVDVDVD